MEDRGNVALKPRIGGIVSGVAKAKTYTLAAIDKSSCQALGVRANLKIHRFKSVPSVDIAGDLPWGECQVAVASVFVRVVQPKSESRMLTHVDQCSSRILGANHVNRHRSLPGNLQDRQKSQVKATALVS